MPVRAQAPTLFLRRPDGTLDAPVPYAQIKYIERCDDLGTWTIELPYNEQTLQATTENWGVIGTEYGKTIVSGQITKPEVAEPTSRTAGKITLTGVDDKTWIDRAMAWPTPANAPANQSVDYDRRSGVASTVLLGYLNANIGPGARAERRVDRVQLDTDPLVGATISEQARFDELLSIVQSVCLKGGITLTCRVELDGSVRYGAQLPRDLSADLKFSTKLGNATDVTWSHEGGISDLIGGGQGDLDQRLFVTAGNATTRSVWGRREGFYDYRNADPAQLQADTTAKLTEQGPTRSASFTPVDTDRVRFDRDYGLGDLVSFETLRYRRVDSWTVQVREVERTWNRAGGRTAVPRIGDVGATATSRRNVGIREMERRLSRLERGV
jgi:hypothetical protein